ncbi:MAG: permease, partial [Rhodospirillaceae bacterium]|nr:permease [Rhodospirillaceae bacterium]
ASPVMDPEMFILTAAAIGPGFAVAKTAAAFAIGLAGGGLAHGLVRASRLTGSLRPGIGGCGSGCGATAEEPKLRWAVWREPARLRVLFREAWQAAFFLGKWLLLAFALESLMAAYLPPGLVASVLGDDNGFAIPLAAAIGVPAYLNGYAAIPVVAELMRLGMAPGAAMTFMVAGGITSIPAAAAVLAVVRLPVFALYVAMALAGALAAGYAYQFVA